MPRWLQGYLLMVKWFLLSYRPWLSINFAVQIGIAIGFIYGISFFFPMITPEIAKFLTTGAPTLILLIAGFVIGPQIIASSRLDRCGSQVARPHSAIHAAMAASPR